MDRLAEMREYSAAFGGLDDQDFLAAGYTPEEVAAYRGGSQPPSLTPQDRSAMLDQYGTLEVPEYSMRDTATQRVQDALIRNVGMDPYEAGRYARRILGDPSSQNILDGLGLADLTPVGAAFAIEEGSATTAAGYREGDPLKMALGVLEAGLGVAEAVPLTAAAARGISGMASRMDPNTLFSMVGPPIPPRAAPAPEATASGIKVFHGSPYDFDRFSMEKIGTGEGAQAYGPGLYFAESEEIARSYAAMRSSDLENLADVEIKYSPNASDDDVIETVQKLSPNSDKLDIIAAVRNARQGLGNMYEATIAADPADFLDYDMPLAGQTPRIQEAVRTLAPRAPGMASGQRLLNEIGGDIPNPQGFSADRAKVAASNRLLEAGIPGIKYADAGSRGAGSTTRNFVVFDENLINIVRKYGIAGAATMLGVTALDVESALADNLPPSEWENIVVGAQ